MFDIKSPRIPDWTAVTTRVTTRAGGYDVVVSDHVPDDKVVIYGSTLTVSPRGYEVVRCRFDDDYYLFLLNEDPKDAARRIVYEVLSQYDQRFVSERWLRGIGEEAARAAELRELFKTITTTA